MRQGVVADRILVRHVVLYELVDARQCKTYNLDILLSDRQRLIGALPDLLSTGPIGLQR